MASENEIPVESGMNDYLQRHEGPFCGWEMKVDLSFVALREKTEPTGRSEIQRLQGHKRQRAQTPRRKEAVPGSDSRLLGAPLGAEAVEGAPGAMGGGVCAGPSLPGPTPDGPLACRLWQPDWRAPAAAVIA